MHVYAAGSALYETDTMQPAPLLAWRPIPIRDADDATLSVGQILAIAVVRERGAIVLATDTGIWWAAIPPGGGVNYTFSQAQLLPGVSPCRQALQRRCGRTSEPRGGRVLGQRPGHPLGIFLGDWGGPRGQPAVHGTRQHLRRQRTEDVVHEDHVVFPKDRKQMYAVCSGSGVVPTLGPNGRPTPDGVGGLLLDGDDFILAVLRSKDGGQSWSPTSADIRGQTLPAVPWWPRQRRGRAHDVRLQPVHRGLAVPRGSGRGRHQRPSYRRTAVSPGMPSRLRRARIVTLIPMRASSMF